MSHETIYQCLYVQTRGSLRADLYKCLSTKRAAGTPRGAPGRTGGYAPVRYSRSATVPLRPTIAPGRVMGRAI